VRPGLGQDDGHFITASLLQENSMNRIVHLALKVDDLEKTTAFYRKVFGFREIETRKTLCLSPREVR
jgi:catechol-2,3-dioxygenase